jgi:membrane fusion protein (multidrug efflux system)
MFASVLIVPQEATFEIQDKVFVYGVGDSNKIVTKPIIISGRTQLILRFQWNKRRRENCIYPSVYLINGCLRDGMPINTSNVFGLTVC